MFGGKNEDGQIIGNLRVLKPGTKPLQWVYPEAEGTPPCPRYLHSLTFIPSSNSLFVFGGYNDSSYFNDGFLFNLNSSSWMSCKFYGILPPPRASHSAVWFGSFVILFGGINADGFLSVDIGAFEFDSKKIKEKIDFTSYHIEKPQNDNENTQAPDSYAESPGLSALDLTTKPANNKRKKTDGQQEKEENFLSLMPVPSLEPSPGTERRMRKLTTLMSGFILPKMSLSSFSKIP